MMFSTKAEYGVRVMVELARRAGDEPCRSRRSPSTTACRSPTWSTSSRACARRAWSTVAARLARRLPAGARAPSRSRWPRSSRRWRGRSPRSSASLRAADGSIVCSRESDPRPRLPDQAAVDARALLDRAHAAGDDARRPRSRPRSRRPRRACPALSRSTSLPTRHAASPTDRNPNRTLDDRSLSKEHGRSRNQQPARAHRGARDPHAAST